MIDEAQEVASGVDGKVLVLGLGGIYKGVPLCNYPLSYIFVLCGFWCLFHYTIKKNFFNKKVYSTQLLYKLQR